jgi:glycosyltransferase involved in cell wall biosynthesis
MSTPPRVSVVVPVKDGEGTLGVLLDALAAQTRPADEVLVVDNGSSDRTVELAKGHPAVTRVLHEPRPGSYAARNTGLAEASGDLLAFTDGDCKPTPGWLAAGVAALADHDLVGGRVEVLGSAAPSVWERLDAGHYLDQQRNVEQEGFAATANFFARAEVLRGLGGFAADLRSGGDREVCIRAARAGHTLGYSADALAEHHPRATFRQTWKLQRRIGYSLRDLHRRDLHAPWYADRQMILSPRWARGTSSTPQVRTSAPAAMGVWGTVVLARWVGRVTGR